MINILRWKLRPKIDFFSPRDDVYVEWNERDASSSYDRTKKRHNRVPFLWTNVLDLDRYVSTYAYVPTPTARHACLYIQISAAFFFFLFRLERKKRLENWWLLCAHLYSSHPIQYARPALPFVLQPTRLATAIQEVCARGLQQQTTTLRCAVSWSHVNYYIIIIY